jgi:enoyl-[acyl-carrier protein] reductase I
MSSDIKLLEGKRGLIMGVANDRSIAWGIAKAASEHGAELAFTYQGDALLKRVKPLAESVNSSMIMPCDVTDESSVDHVFKIIEKEWGSIDFVVHAIAFSDKTELDGLYIDTSRDNFLKTMDISVYSFTSVAQKASKLLSDDGSLLTLTYYGAERVMPHYNVMGVAKAALEASVRYLASDLGPRGIRVNAISAGPIKTLAASGIGDFRYILKWNELNSPLRRNVTVDDVGRSGLFLLSELGSGVTGEVLHVDSGYHTVGMVQVDSAEKTAELLQSISPKKADEAA